MPCANELLLGWVGEWLETARDRNSKGVTVYKKAYDSLKACPYFLTHPSEAQNLQGIGEKLCARLTEKLKEHCEANGLPMPKRAGGKKRKSAGASGDHDDEESESSPKKKPRKQKPYVPALRSGAYALVLGLATLDENSRMGITKPELIEIAQPNCDSSFTTVSHTNKFYTAWNSMKTLVEKELVFKKGRPERYHLTDEGWEVARRIQMTHDPRQGRKDEFIRAEDESDVPDTIDPPAAKPAESDIVPQGDIVSSESELPKFNPTVLQPGSFSVELVLDVREVRAKQDRDYVQNKLAEKGVTPIMRSLALGDIIWVAKVHDANLLSQRGAEGDEILLDYIVERKRLDDLVSSIKDGRFHEQKFRLGKSGVKNVTYIIEEFSMNADHFQKYELMVQSAIASTQVVNGYFIKKTQMMDDSIRYLVNMTKILKQKYETRPLYLIPTKTLTTANYLPLLAHLKKKEPAIDYHITYSAFASMSSKSDALTLRDIFLKMLMCTKGITGEKALEIQKRWKTPIELVEAYQKLEDTEQGKKKKLALMSDQMGNLVGRKKIAKALSVKVAEVWGDVLQE